MSANAVVDVTVTLTLANTAYRVPQGLIRKIEQIYVTGLAGSASAEIDYQYGQHLYNPNSAAETAASDFAILYGDSFTDMDIPGLILKTTSAGSVVTLRLMGRR